MSAVAGCALCGLLAGCQTLFDAPSLEDIAAQEGSRIMEEAIGDQITRMTEAGTERITTLAADAPDGLQRVIVFPYPGNAVGVSTRSWPVMRVDRVAQAQPQLVLESPIRGLVFLDDREIGLVQDNSVRFVTLAAGEHSIRIEQARLPPMVAQFYIENGERITLRWESR